MPFGYVERGTVWEIVFVVVFIEIRSNVGGDEQPAVKKTSL
jgi:hypothetical protein